MNKIYFASPDVKESIRQAINFLKKNKISDFNLNINLLVHVLSIIQANAYEFDDSCQYNIDLIGNQFISEISDITNIDDDDKLKSKIDYIFPKVYRFLLEFDLSKDFDLNRDLRNFIKYCHDNTDKFSSESKIEIEDASKWMSISVIKKLFGNPDIKKYIEHSVKYDEINQRIDSWDQSLRQRERNIDNLKETLKKYETAFNFVGLYKGFDDLYKENLKEYLWSQRLTVVLGISTLIPLSYRVYTNSAHEIKVDLILYLLEIAPYIAITFLILYFFKISYRLMDNIKSQILQIELRKTLCQFVQDYAEFSSDASKKSPETLKKFESVIFSNIVSTSEKIPSTFDGIESLTHLISLAKSNK